MSKKILIIAGDCAEDYEVKVSQQSLQMLGYEVHITAPNKKKGDTLQLVVHDFLDLDTYTESKGHRIGVDISLSDVSSADYDGLIIPGGRAPEYIKLHTDVIETVKSFFKYNKPVAAICHGTQVLAEAEVMKGYEVTSYPACALECRLSGAIWKNEPVVVSSNLVTAQDWTNTPDWMRAFVGKLI